MNFVLIIAIHVGALGDGNSNALTTVPGYKSKVTCEAAAVQIRQLMVGTVKEVRTQCLEVK